MDRPRSIYASHSTRGGRGEFDALPVADEIRPQPAVDHIVTLGRQEDVVPVAPGDRIALRTPPTDGGER